MCLCGWALWLNWIKAAYYYYYYYYFHNSVSLVCCNLLAYCCRYCYGCSGFRFKFAEAQTFAQNVEKAQSRFVVVVRRRPISRHLTSRQPPTDQQAQWPTLIESCDIIRICIPTLSNFAASNHRIWNSWIRKWYTTSFECRCLGVKFKRFQVYYRNFTIEQFRDIAQRCSYKLAFTVH